MPRLPVQMLMAPQTAGAGSAKSGWGLSVQGLEYHTKKAELIHKSNKKQLNALRHKST